MTRDTITLHSLPSTPATAALDNLRDSGVSLVRQLENRVAELPALADRVESDRATASTQAQNAAQALQAPFKHADALTAAQKRSEQIAAAMQQRQHEPPPAVIDATAGAGAADADLAELKRLTRASFPQAPTAGEPSVVASARRPKATTSVRDQEAQR